MRSLVIFVFAAVFVRIQGNPVPGEEFFSDDGSGTPPPPPPPTTTAAPSPPPPSTSGPGPTPSLCGDRPSSGARIVGGKETVKNSIPWQAMLRASSQFCGGSLVHKQWVLTAAHCIEGETTSSFKIWLGAHRKEVKEDTTQEFKVAKIVKHPQYNPSSSENDIAMIKLEREAVLGPGVGLVCLGDDKFHLPLDDLNNQCLISGWGTLKSGGNQPDTLQEVMVPLVSHSVCKNAYNYLHDSMLCAGLKEGGKDSCQGDSGGPLVCQYNGKHYLEGATSFGRGCADPNAYGVYAKVRHLRSFVDSSIQAN